MKSATLTLIAILTIFLFADKTSSAPNLDIKREGNSFWNKIEQKKFLFKVSTVLTSGPEMKLADNSMLSVNDTTFSCYLPNYTGLDFTSQSFDYNIRYNKRECVLTMQNTIKNSDQFLLYITKDGYGTLKVIHSDGSGISFRGIIMNK